MPPVKRVLSHRWQPDLIVGVDFGMTCTGVVYAILDHDSTSVPEIKQIKRWPGARGVLEKVPTELVYSNSEPERVESWGAQCKHNSQDWHLSKRLFKLEVPANTTKTEHATTRSTKKDVSESTSTLNEHHDGDSARRYFKDYLTHLCAWVEHTLEDQVPRYRSLRTEYTFSVPTSWSLDTSTLNTINEILREAVGETPSRHARTSLTEAGAAASESGRDANKKGDVVIIVDTGGGTTDINIFKYLSSEKEPARIKALTYDEGADVGSTRIDQCCLDYLTSRILEFCGKDSDRWLKEAEKAVRQDFDLLKHNYDDSSPPRSGYYLLPIGIPRDLSLTSPSLPPSDFEISDRGHGIHFKIPVVRTRKWFDDQIASILGLIDAQIARLQHEHRREKVDRIVLSGGFALNKYYRSQLRVHFNERIRSKAGGISPELEILNAQEPHLAVVRGLVYNRAREVLGMGSLYDYVVCPTSFGFVVSEEYSKMRHGNLGEIPEVSALDGKQWIRGQIDWVIEEGVSVPSRGLKKEYDILLHANDEGVTQTFQIVSCDNPRKNLPRNISHKAVKKVCEIKLDVSKLAVEKRKRKFSISKTMKGKLREDQEDVTREARLDLWMLIGAADLRFEAKPRGEEDSLVSLEHDDIDVMWANAQERDRGKGGVGEAPRTDVIVKKSFRQSLSVRSPSFN